MSERLLRSLLTRFREAASAGHGRWRALVAAVACCLPGTAALAATVTWTGVSGTTWSTAGSWSPNAPTSTDSLQLADTTTGNVLILDSGTQTIDQFIFRSSTNTGFTVRTTTNALVINGGISAPAGGSLGMSGNFIVGGDQTWSGVGVTFGSVTDAAGTTTGPGTVTLNKNLQWSGGSTLTFAVTSVTGSGNMVMDGGTLRFSASSGASINIQGTGTTVLNNASTMEFLLSAGGLNTVTRAIQMNGTSRIINNNNAQFKTSTIASPIEFNGTHAFTFPGNTWTFSGVWSGTGNVQLATAGVTSFTISGTNTFSGAMRFTSGTTRLSNVLGLQNATVDLASGDTGSVSLVTTGTYTIGALTGSRGFDLGTRTVRVGNNNASTTYSGALSNGSFVKVGSGTLTLSGTNTHGGGTTVSAGTLLVGGTSAFGDAAGNVVAAGGVLDLGNYAITRTGTVSFTGGTVQSGTITNDTVAFDGQAGTVAAGLAGSAGLTKSGAGTLTLSAANTYGGTTKITGGLLSIAHASALQNSTLDMNSADSGAISFNQNSTLGGLTGSRNVDVATSTLSIGNNNQSTTYSGTLGGSGGLTKIGTGTLTLTGSSTYGGTTSVTAGTLQIGAGGPAGAVNGSSALALAGGTLFVNRSGAFTQAFAGTMLAAGVSSVAVTATGTVNFGAITRNAGAALDLPTTGSFLTSTPNTSGILPGITYGDTTWAVANGAAPITGLASYTTTTAAGTTNTNYANANIDVNNSAGALSGVVAPNSLRFNSAGATTVTLAAGGMNTVASGILVNAAVGDNLSTITGGTLAGSSGGDLAVIQNNTANRLVIGSAIVDNGSATGLTKSGAGALVLSAANTYTGTTRINTGTLQLGDGGTAGSMSPSSVIAAAAGTTLAFARSNTITQGVDFAGVIGGVINVSQVGTGTLVLNGVNTYTGTTSVGAGTLQVGDGGTTGSLSPSSAITGAAGGTLAFARSNTVTQGVDFAGVIGGAINVSQVGSGTLVLNGVNTYTGTTSVNAGTLQIGNGGAAGSIGTSAAITGSAGGTLAFNRTNAVTQGTDFPGVIGGSIAVSQIGSGTLTLSGNNTYSGVTTLSAGQLNVNGANAIGSGTFTILGGTLDNTSGSGVVLATNNPQNWNADLTFVGSNALDLGTGAVTLGASRQVTVTSSTLTVGGAIGGAFGLTKAGGGTLALAANNTYTGTTAVSAGVLTVVGSGSAFGNSVVSLGTAGGGTLDVAGYSQAIGGLTGGTAGGFVRIGSGTLAVGSANVSTTYSGSFAGTNWTLGKQGAGILTLNGTSTTLAGASLQAGQLALMPAAGSTFALGTLSRTAGSTLQVQPGSGKVIVDAATSVSSGMIGPWAVTGSTTSLTYATHTSGTVVGYSASGTAATAASLPNSASANVLLQSATGAVPSTVSANTIRFTGAANTTSNTSSSFTVNGLMNAGSGAWTINSGTITIGSTGELVVATNAQNVTIGSVIRESGTVAGLTFISQGGGLTLSATSAPGFSGPINATGGSLTLNGSGTYASVNMSGNTLTVSAALRIGGITGVGANFVKQGSGTLSLLGTNSYTGTTSIQAGVVEITSLPAIGTAGSLGNATTTSGTISIGTSSTSATLRYVGSVASTTDRVIDLTGTTGGATLDAGGVGPLVFTSAFTASGNGNKTLTLTGTSTALNTIFSVPNSTGTTSVDKTGIGAWKLSGSSSYSGQLRVLDGTLVVGANVGTSGNSPFGASTSLLPQIGGTTAGLSGTAALLLADGVTVQRGLSIASGTDGSSMVVLGGVGSGTSTFTAAADVPLGTGRNFTLQAGNGGLVTFGNTFATGTAQSVTFGSAGNAGTVLLNQPLVGSSYLVAVGTARLGGFGLSNVGALFSPSPVTVGSSLGRATLDLSGTGGPVEQTMSSLTFAGTSSLVSSGTLRLGYINNATLQTFSGVAPTSTALVTATGTGHEISSTVVLGNAATFGVTNAGDRLRVSGAISGSYSLTKNGVGTLELTASNAYTGATTINSGTLQIGGSAGALNPSSTISGSAGALLVFNRSSSISQGNDFANAITGAGLGVTQLGQGTTTLAAGNTYTGTTTVTGGVLALGASDAISNASDLFVNGGGFNLNGNTDTVASVVLTSGSVYGTGKLTAATYGLSGGSVGANLGSGTVTVTGNAALNGTSDATALNLNAGALTLGGGGGRFTSASIAVTGSSGASLALGGNETFGSLAGAAGIALGANRLTVGGADASTSYAGVISGAGGLTKTGLGRMTFTAAQTYAGSTILSGGTLALGAAGSFANSSRIVVGDSNSSGAVLDLRDKASLTIGAGQTLQGKGTVLLDAVTALTVSGTLAPGNSPGLLTFDGGTTTLAGTTLMEIWGTSRGANPGYDAVNVNNFGTLVLGGALQLDFTQTFGNDTFFDLFTADLTSSLASTFGSITMVGSAYGDLSFTNNAGLWSTNTGVNDQSMTFDSTTGRLTVLAAAVPEPSTLVLAGLGLAGLALRLRRRHRRRKESASSTRTRSPT